MGACGKHKRQSCVHCGNGLLRKHRKLQINLFVRGNVNCLEWLFYILLDAALPPPPLPYTPKKNLEFCQSINFFSNPNPNPNVLHLYFNQVYDPN